MKRLLLVILPLLILMVIVLGFALGSFSLVLMGIAVSVTCIIFVGLWVYIVEWIADKLNWN